MSRRDFSFGVEVPSISTRAELDQRIASRPKPAIEQHLTPDGWQQVEVNRGVDAFSESRIKTLESRLNRAGDAAKHDHRMANVRDRARRDFERSR